MITSASNPKIKQIAALMAKAKTRKEEGLFVAEGFRLIAETPVERLVTCFISDEADPEDEGDPMLGDAVDVIMETGQASASMLQRRLKLGYARAARIIDQMEARGIIGPFDGSRPRQIMISKTDWQEMKLRYGVRS